MSKNTKKTEEKTEAPTPFVLPKIPTKKEILTVEIKKLVTNHGTQPRVSTDPEVIADYHELIKTAKANGAKYPLPPISAVRTPEGKIIPYDGFQRIEANKGLHSEIDAECIEGDEHLAVILSLGANATHGARRTSKDKSNAVKRAFQDDQIATLSDGAIAELCAVSTSLVNKLRPAAKSGGVRISRTGKKIKTGRIGTKAGKAPKKPSKKAGKEGKGGEPKPSKAADQKQERLSLLVAKIEKALGPIDGPKVRSAILDGSLELSTKDVQDWAGLSPESAKKIAPLVTGNRFKPWKAWEFSKSDPKEASVVDLQLHALANGGEFTFENGDVKIVVTTKAGK